MNLRGLLATSLALLLSVTPRVAESKEPTGSATCSLNTPAPKGSARLVWKAPNGEEAPGFWVSDEAMQRAAAKLDHCIDLAATFQRDLAVEQGKRIKLGWKAWVAAIGVSVAVGFAVGMVTR